MKIKEIKSKKARKWALRRRDGTGNDRNKLARSFVWSDTKQGYDFWRLIDEINPSTKKLKKRFPHLFK